MKWLIIVPEKEDKEFDSAKKLFNESGWLHDEIFVSDLQDEKKSADAVAKITKSTHCLVLNADSMKDSPWFEYFAGFASGKGLDTLFVGESETVKKIAGFAFHDGNFAKTFSDFDGVQKFLSENSKKIESESLKKESFSSLIKSGISITADSYAYYLEKEKTEICEKIVAAGIDVNSFTTDGVPLLCVAVRAEDSVQIEKLLSLGADINSVSRDRGYSPVMDAVWRKNYDVAKLLIEKGADLNIMSSDGQSILVLAVGNGNAKIVELLLNSGANPDVKDAMGMSARGYASLFKNEELVKLMEKFPAQEAS
jgi:hypothetical protein